VNSGVALAGEAHGLPAAAMSRNVGGMGSHWACATPNPRGAERADFISTDDWERALATGRRLLATNEKPQTDTEEWAECLSRLECARSPATFPGHRGSEHAACVSDKPDGSIYWTGTDVILGDLASQPRETFAIAADHLLRPRCSRRRARRRSCAPPLRTWPTIQHGLGDVRVPEPNLRND
jgi:hypothetical protein